MKSIIKTISAVAIAVAAINNTAFAQLATPFTPGNLVLERFGNGSAALNANGTPIFLDQYTTSGVLVSSQMIPTNGASQLVASGNSGTEGFMCLNPNNGTNLVLAGYNVAAGFTTPNSATAVAAPRAVGTVDGSGNYNLVLTTTIGESGSNPRSVATDGGTNYWINGGVIGVFYMGTGPTNYVSTTVANERTIQVVGTNLYFSTGSGTTRGVYKIPGTPMNTGNVATSLINSGAATAPEAFSFNPGLTVAYVAETTVFSTSAGVGGIEKWTNNAGVWGFAYSLAPGNGNGASGIAVDWNTVPPTIYATTANGNFLVKVQDNGAGTVATTNATAAANTGFRGMIFAPTNTSTAVAPSLTGISPASQTVGVGSTATFTLSGSTGNPIASNNWYVISGGVTNLISSQHAGVLTFANAQVSDTANYFAILTNASGSVTSSVVSLTVQNSGPTNLVITPLSGITNTAGLPASFTVTSAGTPPFSYFWYKEIIGTSTNLITDATNATLSFPSAAVSDTASYQVVVSNGISPFVATSSVVVLKITNAAPTITSITPASITTNAGQVAVFTVTNTGTAPLTYLWYKEIVGVSTNLITGATNSTLTLASVLAGDGVNYQVIITNASGSATSSVVTLTVTGDPSIAVQPASSYGLLKGAVQFYVGAIATSPSYQWYYSTTANPGGGLTPVSNGTRGDGSVVFGATTSTLLITNLQSGDVTNFVVTVTNVYGAVTSSVASILAINTSGSWLTFWDFNGPEFTNYIINPTCVTFPAPYYGVGSATAVGTAFSPGGVFPFTATSSSPFSGSVDPNDGPGFTLGNRTPFSWGTVLYPTNGNPALNKTAGAQFSVSTVGAKNIKFSYESRATGTASKYERLQFTTNGTDWVDYPSSTTIPSAFVSLWEPYNYDLTGFPGVANNPNFGVRIMTEIESTATYGVSGNTNFVGVANTYGAGGTLTYDLVTVSGDAITSTNQPPVVGGFMNTNMVDYIPLTNNFTVSDDSTPVNSLTYNAVSLNPSSFNASFTFEGSGANRKLIIHPNSISASVAAAPILVTVTDGNGDSTVTWFDVTVTTINFPPSSTLVSTTNMLANTNLVIPFTVTDDHTPTNGQSFTVTVSSGNAALIPNDTANNIIINNITANTNYTLTIVPATNQVGLGTVTVNMADNDLNAAKTTSTTIPVMVRPNTNIVMVDFFDYNGSGPLDSKSGGYWQHLSGNINQLTVFNGVVTVNTFTESENLIAPLLGAPYTTNSGVLYASLVVNMDPQAEGSMPRVNGSYFTAFQIGSTVAQIGNNATSLIEGCLVAATNGAADGFYRLGVNNRVGGTALNSAMSTQDLTPGNNYLVVMSLVLSNGFTTLWINPTNQSSPSVTDTANVATGTNLINIGAFELRSSGVNVGKVAVSRLLVGKTFNSVIYPPVANPDAFSIVENSSGNVLDPLLNDSGTSLRLISLSPTNPPTVSGNQVIYTPPFNFVGTTNFTYTVMDNIGGTNSSVITVTVAAPTSLIPTNSASISSFALSGSNVVIGGTNAQSGGTYYLLTSTNVASPFSLWAVVATNIVNTNGPNGAFTFTGTNAVTPGKTNQFYILSNTNWIP